MRRYTIRDILPFTDLPAPPNRGSYNVRCPHCDRDWRSRDKHLNIDLVKDVFNCPKCNFNGGIFDLYAFYTGTPREQVKAELDGIFNDKIAFHKTVSPQATEQPYVNPECELSAIETRDAVYRALLAKLTLAADHMSNLTGRGLSEAVINRNGYRSTPVFGHKTLAKQLCDAGLSLAGVPGFYKNGVGEWTLVCEDRGILIPAKDIQGRIQGLQIRRDNEKKRKFRWVSSRDRQDGCGSKTWTHFAGPVRDKILLIEGPLKADVIFHLTGQSVLAVPGVNSLPQLEHMLTLLKESGVRQIMTAFDMDFLRKFSVQNGYTNLIGILKKLGFKYGTFLWNPDCNGLDDYVWERYMKKNVSSG